jgi:hypothetical protein
MAGAGSVYLLKTGAEVVVAGATLFLKVHFPPVDCYKAKLLSISY